MHEGTPPGAGGRADEEIVAAIVVGDPSGLAAAYSRYAAVLHAYCYTLLADPADAADAVQDTFIIAASKLDGIRDPARLRPWLYAVARNECRRRLRARGGVVRLAEAGQVMHSAPEVGASAEQQDLRRLVRSALAGLNPGEREIIELNLRHELDGADLADVLGVPRSQAHAFASRARAQFETSLGALLVARTGREYCADLAAILDGWYGELTVLLRKRVNRHIERCEICGARKRRELSPAMLLSLFPVIVLPAGLRQQVLRMVSDRSPEAASYRDLVVRRAEPLRRNGFPVPLDPPRAARWRGNYALTAGAAATVLLVLGGGALFAAAMVHQTGHPEAGTLAAGAPATSPTPTPAPTPASPLPPASPVPSPHHHPRKAPHRSASPRASLVAGPASSPATAPPSRSPSPSSRPTTQPTPRPSPSPGQLVVSPAVVQLAQASANGPYTGTFTLTPRAGR